MRVEDAAIDVGRVVGNAIFRLVSPVRLQLTGILQWRRLWGGLDVRLGVDLLAGCECMPAVGSMERALTTGAKLKENLRFMLGAEGML